MSILQTMQFFGPEMVWISDVLLKLSCTLINFRWFEYKTEVLSCQQNRLVPASTSHRKDLIEKIDNLKAGGTSELK